MKVFLKKGSRYGVVLGSKSQHIEDRPKIDEINALPGRYIPSKVVDAIEHSEAVDKDANIALILKEITDESTYLDVSEIITFDIVTFDLLLTPAAINRRIKSSTETTVVYYPPFARVSKSDILFICH